MDAAEFREPFEFVRGLFRPCREDGGNAPDGPQLMSTRVARFALAATAVLAVVGVWLAARPDSARVVTSPELTRSAALDTDVPVEANKPNPSPLPVLAKTAPPIQNVDWLNSAPLGTADLNGHVVLYEFWTFGCYNCQHVIPHIQAWHERYAKDGLIVVSIHTPEFSHEADPKAVEENVAKWGITFPVALDPDSEIWNAFGNEYWPAIYLHDQAGRRRLMHIGEGAYEETEDAIRALLGVSPDTPRASSPTDES